MIRFPVFPFLVFSTKASPLPWSSVASASTVIRQRWPTPTRAELQGDGKACVEHTGKRRRQQGTGDGGQAEERIEEGLSTFPSILPLMNSAPNSCAAENRL